MKDLSQEVIYGLLIAVIVLFQYLIKRFAPQQPAEPLPDMLEETAETPAPALPVIEVGEFGRGRPNDAPPSVRRYSRQALMGSRREVQKAIVIATIMGPCRADEPYQGM